MALVPTKEQTVTSRGEGVRDHAVNSGTQTQTATQKSGDKRTTQTENPYDETTLVDASQSVTTSREESPIRLTTSTTGLKSSRRTEQPSTQEQIRTPSETVQTVTEDPIIQLSFTLTLRKLPC